MTKWADYLISKVSYIGTGTDKNRHIDKLLVHEYNEKEQVKQGNRWDREKVIKSIDNKKTFCTIISTNDNKYNKGAKVIKQETNGKPYIKTQPNDIEEDNLGELPEFN